MTTATSIANKLAAAMAKAVEVGECLEWQGPFSCKGVTPIVKAKHPGKPPSTRKSENFSVPRLLWERDHGEIPKGKLVYRACCNNACVLGAHLRCGTRADWAKARKRAGVTAHSTTTKIHLTLSARKRAGVTNTMHKAREVRSLAAAGVKGPQISQRTGVHPTMVADIQQGRSWRELGASPFTSLIA